jgi:hypothetical protein
MSSPSPRPKYNFKDVSKDKPLRVPIVSGDRRNAMKALRAAYAWGKRHKVVMFGTTEYWLGDPHMVIRRHP